jgi:hypothetical protein
MNAGHITLQNNVLILQRGIHALKTLYNNYKA